jgi:glycosyltransferase involved in cell wall biosynthesis
MPLSILILTYNEAINMADCLSSVAWSDDIVVLDSFSTDETVAIARSMNARVVQRRFDDYASQRNFALQQIEFHYPWVLMLDADERVPADLREEMRLAVTRAPPDLCLLRCRRRDYLYGRWIRRSSGYPTWFGRLMRVGRARAERPFNEEIKTDGTIAALAHHLDHYPFNKGFHEWIAKHDRYSTMEAEFRHRTGGDPWGWSDLIARDPGRRRIALKGIVYSMPLRPALVFAGLYFVRGGLLEGRAGITFCLLRAWYEFMIDCKYRELTRRAQGLPV